MNEMETVKKFIFNDEIQNDLSTINDNFMDFNILEITGMGSQEIRHSNILGWLLDDSEHGFQYKILDDFLKKVIALNGIDTEDCDKKEILDALQAYIYLPEQKKDIVIYREKYNIDLLIVDEKNEVVITIENKVYASESKNQLEKYKGIVNDKYEGFKNKYFIFLTINLDEPANHDSSWLKANHQMITDVLSELLKVQEAKHDITMKSQIIFESYIDLLKRRKIVEDKDMQDLATKIWGKSEYKQALDILYEYKPDITLLIGNYLKDEKLREVENTEPVSSSKGCIRFADTRWDELTNQKSGNHKWNKNIERVLLYEFNNFSAGLTLDLIIGPSNDENYREYLYTYINTLIGEINKTVPDFKLEDHKGMKLTKWQRMFKIQILSKDELENKTEEEIKEKINTFFCDFFPEKYDVISELILTRCNSYNNPESQLVKT